LTAGMQSAKNAAHKIMQTTLKLVLLEGFLKQCTTGLREIIYNSLP